MDLELQDDSGLEMFGNSFGGSSPRSLESSPSDKEDETCTICSDKFCNPRVLSCLHVFCETCLNKRLVDEASDTLKTDPLIKCPRCEQETKVTGNGAGILPCDYVLANLIDMAAMENMAVICTSCKTKEKAVARCCDCANFLCPNCNTAHQFMRCFENHNVLSFEELKTAREAIPIHKPIFCEKHPTETMKSYCITCQIPICNDCLLSNHKVSDHQLQRLGEAEDQQREEIKGLIMENKAKLDFYDEAYNQLQNSLSELQIQHDSAKQLIEETFQSYKAILEKCRDSALEELEKIHKEREMKVMESFHTLEKTMEKITDATKFSERILTHGNSVELLILTPPIKEQLLLLINNNPKTQVSTTFDFITDMKKFEAAVKDAFGYFRDENATSPKESTPSLPSTGQLTVTSSGSPVSLISVQSSFDGDLASAITPGFSLHTGLLNTEPPVAPLPTTLASPLPPTLQGLTSIQEYNLQQLASLAEKDVSSVVPAPSPDTSPTPSFTLADLFSGDLSSTSNALNNIQALAKLGSVTLNTQGQIVVNPKATASLVDALSPGRTTGIGDHSSPLISSGQVLGALLSDLASNALNGASELNGDSNGLLLGRGSPALSINTTIASLNGGGFHQTLSGTPSPIVSQTDELLSDSLHNIPLSLSGSNLPLASSLASYHINRNSAGKVSPMQIRCKYGQLGPAKGQFNSPHGFCLGCEEDIIVADTNNHRVQVFDKTGLYKFQFGIPGKEEGQLWYPRKVAVMRNSGKFVVCDRGNERSRMQIFSKNGHFIKKIAIRYIDIVAGLAVTSQGHIVAVDSVSPTVFVISESGDLLRWFDCSDYMREPSDIAISGKEYFVCDFKGHCVVVFNEDGQFLRRIGCESITNFPNGIDISDAGDVLVGDSHGNRFHVAVFTRDGSMLCEFECPYVKVSRCCGLKITSEGYVVTLAKNNHHVLVLDTLYIM